jgi:hypothetical protein
MGISQMNDAFIPITTYLVKILRGPFFTHFFPFIALKKPLQVNARASFDAYTEGSLRQQNFHHNHTSAPHLDC